MVGCCVQVQCTLSHMARGNHMHMVPICISALSIAGWFDNVHCTLCEKKEDEPNSGVQRCKCSTLRSCKMYPLYRNLQHVV